jgi:two-component system LytT family response regulator
MTAPAMKNSPSSKLTVLIVDDERVARARLRRLLAEEPDVEVVAECDNGKDAVTAIIEQSPDLVFLDVEMPELNGFQVLQSLEASQLPAFVFVTAYNDYALDAFAVNALDYLLKPFDAERFQITMHRARARIKSASGDRRILDALRELTDVQQEIRAAVTNRGAPGGPTRGHGVERLAAKSDGRIVFVRVEDIDYIESAANYVRVYTGTERHMIREKIGDLAQRLDPARFARIHRTVIVNLDRIKEIQPWFSGDALVILRSGVKLRMSRVFRGALDLGSRTNE